MFDSNNKSIHHLNYVRKLAFNNIMEYILTRQYFSLQPVNMELLLFLNIIY